MDPLATARYGLFAAERRFDAAATEIAQAPANPEADYAAGMVDMIQAKHAFSANLSVVRFADDMWKSLLEIQSK
jgi:flagellar basal body rod protein FlgC